MLKHDQRFSEIAPSLSTCFLEQYLFGYEATLLLRIALECGVFDIIGGAALTAGELAMSLGGDLTKTAAFLDALASLACLVKKGESYRLSPAAGLFLRRNSAHSACDLLQARFNRLQKMQNAGWELFGPPSSRAKTGQGAAGDFSFTRIMAQSAVSSGNIAAVARRVARDPDFGRARLMLDLGCSHGLYTAALCLLNKDLHAVLYDRPGVLRLTRGFLERCRFGERVEYRSGDFNVDSIGHGYDLVLASNVFYRSPDQSIPVLKKICQSLKPGGLLYLQHRYLDSGRISPAPAALYYCTRVLRMPGFYVATLSEAVDWLRQAGFNPTSIHRSRRTGNTLLRARKAR